MGRVRTRWSGPYQTLRPTGPYAQLERRRAWRPSVVEEPGATRRMWYSADDGTTTRIVHAQERLEFGWARQGACVEPGLAGETDGAAVEAPSVVRGRHGYLMAYSGSDGAVTRTHLATSRDGWHWRPWGPAGIEGGPGAQASSPCLVTAEGRLMLFQAAPTGDGPSAIHVATASGDGAWSSRRAVLAPRDGESGLFSPWVLAEPQAWTMFLVARGEGGDTAIELAVSSDGTRWERRPAPLDVHRRHPDGGRLDHPAAVRLRSGALRLFYTALPEGADTGPRRLWYTDLVSGASTAVEGTA